MKETESFGACVGGKGIVWMHQCKGPAHNSQHGKVVLRQDFPVFVFFTSPFSLAFPRDLEMSFSHELSLKSVGTYARRFYWTKQSHLKKKKKKRLCGVMKSFVQLRSGLMALSVSVQTKQKGAFKMAFSHIDVQLIFFERSLLCTVGLVSFEYVCAVTRSIPFDQLIYFT